MPLSTRHGRLRILQRRRTVRRCTPCLRASSRIESPSTLASRRICANSSNLTDLIPGPPRHQQHRRDHAQVGANNTDTATPASQQLGPLNSDKWGRSTLTQPDTIVGAPGRPIAGRSPLFTLELHERGALPHGDVRLPRTVTMRGERGITATVIPVSYPLGCETSGRGATTYTSASRGAELRSPSR